MTRSPSNGTPHKILVTGRTDPFWVQLYESLTPPEFQLVWVKGATAPPEEVLAEIEFAAGNPPIEWLPKMPRLKLVQQGGVGYVDSYVTAVRARGVPFAITPEGTCLGVAEHTILLMLAVYKHLAFAHAAMKAGQWPHDDLRQRSYFLYDKVVGIAGLGRIGTDVARRLRGFEPRKVLYYDLFRKSPEVEAELGVEYADLDTLLRESDVVTLHVFLSEDSRHLIGERELSLMKETAVLINTSRGEVIDEAALYRTLRDNRIWGAGLDAWTQEPTPSDNPILQLPNVTCTPHMATGTVDADRMKFEAAIANFRRVLSGEAPINVVRPYREVTASA
jgi:glyoxylate reductase